MSALQAAFGTAQLERSDEIINKKREIFSWYEDRLKDVPNLLLNGEPKGVKNSYWMVTCIQDQKEFIQKENLMKFLLDKRIQTRPFFNQLSKLPAYLNEIESKKASTRNNIAAYLAPRGINLPSALSLNEEDIDYVCKSLKEIFSK